LSLWEFSSRIFFATFLRIFLATFPCYFEKLKRATTLLIQPHNLIQPSTTQRNHQQATDNKQQATDNKQQTTNNKQQSSNNMTSQVLQTPNSSAFTTYSAPPIMYATASDPSTNPLADPRLVGGQHNLSAQIFNAVMRAKALAAADALATVGPLESKADTTDGKDSTTINSGAYQKPFPNEVWLHMKALKDSGKTLKESLGEINTLAEHLTGRTMHISTMRRAWSGRTKRSVTGIEAPKDTKRRRKCRWMKKDIKKNPKSATETEKVARAIALILDARKKQVLSSPSKIAKIVGLKPSTVSAIKARRTWAWMYEQMETEAGLSTVAPTEPVPVAVATKPLVLVSQ
jgi:hypothetical protein